jgi:chorismate mutase
MRPGSRVVAVCGRRFTNPSLSHEAREMIIIHELLHALGLGENPPTIEAITRQVTERCGRAVNRSS